MFMMSFFEFEISKVVFTKLEIGPSSFWQDNDDKQKN
jgi:hypothetical protein